MNNPYADKCALVIDNGLFVDLSIKLAEEFGKVYYWQPWANGFPTSNGLMPGDGFEGVVRVKDPWDYVDESDVIVFPDLYHCDWQHYLENSGKRVWGARYGEELERSRVPTKKYLKEIGLPVGPYKEITGIDSLRAYLKERDGDKIWIKVSDTRGDGETWCHEGYDISEVVLDELERKLGAKKNIMRWVCEDDISPAIEVGYDGWTIDGQYPDPCLFGWEIKDMGYIGAVKAYNKLGEPILKVNAALSDAFSRYGYRGFFSSELRVTPDGSPYLIDPCCRLPSPPHEVELELFSNWADIIYRGAEGVVVPPEPKAQFGVCAMMHSGWATNHWTPIRFPEKIRPFIKLRYWTRVEDIDYFTPQIGQELPEIGAVVGIGDTLEDAVAHCKENAEQVTGYDVEIKLDSLPKAMAEIQKSEDMGIYLADGPIDVDKIKAVLEDEE